MAKASVHPADLLGFGRLAIDGTTHLTGLIEEIHRNVAGAPSTGTTDPITDLVYDSIRRHQLVWWAGAWMPFSLPSCPC